MSTHPYQNAVKRLTDENKRLQEQLTEERRLRHDDVRVLEAQLREGLSPEIVVLRRELRKWRDRATSAEMRLAAGGKRAAAR